MNKEVAKKFGKSGLFCGLVLLAGTIVYEVGDRIHHHVTRTVQEKEADMRADYRIVYDGEYYAAQKYRSAEGWYFINLWNGENHQKFYKDKVKVKKALEVRLHELHPDIFFKPVK